MRLGVGVGHLEALRLIADSACGARSLLRSTSSRGGRGAILHARPFRLAYRIHGIRQRDGIEIVLLRILRQRRVDEEDDRHVTLLASLEPLIGEAKTVDLRK